MDWKLVDCVLPDEKMRVQVTYLKDNKEYCDVFALLVGNEWVTEDADGSVIPFKYKVIAWQYPCSPCDLKEFEENRFEMNIEHFRRYIRHEELDDNSEAHRILGGHMDDIVYIAKPTLQVDINAINELYLYKNCESVYDEDTEPPLTNEDIDSLIVVVCEMGDLWNCEYIRVKRYDKAVQEITEELNSYKNLLN